MAYYTYILASGRNGTLYVGVTRDLVRRVFEHRNVLVPGFSRRYGVHFLVYFEIFDDPRSAIQREKNLKHWSRPSAGPGMTMFVKCAGSPLSR